MSLPAMLSTAEIAELFKVKSSSISHSLSVRGHFQGLQPATKLPNGRNLWLKKDAHRTIYGSDAECQE